jgi:two-component system, cell cycle response regulator DivK
MLSSFTDANDQTPPKIVLNIEDNEENRRLVRRLLQYQGYNVLEAVSAKQALELLDTCIPDLILLDINMPDEDGYSLTMKLKMNPSLNKVPIIAITANALKGDRERTFQAGCDGYIEKPIDIEVFLDTMNRFIG